MRSASAIVVSLAAGLPGIWLFVFPVLALWELLLEPLGWVEPRAQPVNNDDERGFALLFSLLTLAWVLLWGLTTHFLVRRSSHRAALWLVCTLCLLAPFLYAMFGPPSRVSDW